jgi:translation initiation factor 2B subunit (eIF-2B alpha/beta/delta family)
VAELVAQVGLRLRSELDSLIENELAPYREATGALEALSDRSLEELREAETYREIVREQRQAMEARVAELRRQAEERARAEVEKQVEEARKQVDEARDRIEEEARDRIRVPSFGN